MQALHRCQEATNNTADILDDYDQIYLHVYAPTIVEYTKWVLRSARSRGIDRLYFLARDSWLPYRCAGYINEVLGLGLDIRYIYVSRYTLRNAQYSFIGKEALETICVGGIDITFRKLMRRANLTDEEIMAVAEDISFCDRVDECLSYSQVMDIKSRLYQTRRVFEYISNHSGEYYSDIRDYFLQEGLCDEARYAIVDSGWLGTTQMSMQQILSHICNHHVELTGFYFGLYQLPAGANVDSYHSYFLRPNVDFDRKIHFSICLYETLFSEPCGMTLGYESNDDRIEPVLNPIGNPNSDKIKRNAILLTFYLENMQFDSEFLERNEELMIEQLLKLSMGRPTITEAKVMGDLKFCDDVLESGMQNVARTWSRRELVKQSFFMKVLFKFVNSKVKLHESGWPEGSIVNLCGEGLTSKIALLNERGYKRGMYLRKAMELMYRNGSRVQC